MGYKIIQSLKPKNNANRIYPCNVVREKPFTMYTLCWHFTLKGEEYVQIKKKKKKKIMLLLSGV